MKELQIEVDNAASGIRIVRLAGPLTLDTLFEFQDVTRANADSAIVIELSGVSYMDSAGLGAVLGILASCQRKGRGFGIAGATDRIKTLFDVAGVNGLLPSFDSVEVAERHVLNGASA
jgi:anti-anti-sigma factor